MLDADGEADQPRRDPGAGLLGLRQLAVGGRGGVDDEAAHVADVGHVAVQLERLDEPLAGRCAAGDLEGEDGAGSLGCVLEGTRVPRAALEPRVGDADHLVATLQPGGDGDGVLHVPLHPQAQRLESLGDEERVERRHCGTEVAQQLDAGLEDEGEVGSQGAADAEVPGVDEPVVARVGLVEATEPLGVGGVVERPAVDDGTRDRRPVPAEVLRGRVDDDVRAPLQRADQIRRGHGVVDHERHPRRVRDAGDASDVEHVLLRVRDRLREEHLGVRPDGGLPRGEIVGVVDERHGDAELGERVVQQVVGAPVEARARHDVVTGLGHVEQGDRLGRLPRRDQQRTHAPLQAGDPLLDRVRRRVHQPRVDVAELLEPEQVRGVLGVLEDVGRGLVDRQGPGAGLGVGGLACMDLSGLEGPAVAHRNLLLPRGPARGPRLPGTTSVPGRVITRGTPPRRRVAGQRAGA